MAPSAIEEHLNVAEFLVDGNIRLGRGGRPALIEGDRVLTYDGLADRVNRFGHALLKVGVQRGDDVIIRMPMSIDVMVVFLAAVKIGAVAVPTGILLTDTELERVVADSHASALVVTEPLLQEVRDARARMSRFPPVVVTGTDAVDAGRGEHAADDLLAGVPSSLSAAHTHREDPFMVLYTSGSTSTPKAVVRAHRVLAAAGAVNAEHLMRLSPEDVCYQPHQDVSFSYPLGHGLLFPLYAGASAVVASGRREGRFDARLVFEAIERHKVSVFSASVPLIKRMLEVRDAESRYDLSSLRFVTCAAEPLPVETFRAWKRRFGLDLYETMGQSEVPSFVGFFPGIALRPGALGKPFPGVRALVLDDAGREAAVGETGHLVIDASYGGLCSGYRNAPDKWMQVCHDGWYFTQDLVYRDADGYLWYVSRADQVIKIRGYTVAPNEIESVLLEHPAVKDAAVIGVSAQEPFLKAFVVKASDRDAEPVTEAVLRRFLKERLVAYKVPRAIEFRAALPRARTGKLLRKALMADEGTQQVK